MAGLGRAGINNNVLIEKVEVLNGDRGNKQKRAVRLEELDALKKTLSQSSSGGGASDLQAEPYALQSNPGTTPFPSGAYTAIPFFTNTELTGITKTGSSTFTVPTAGLYQFELEVRINGGATSMPPVGTAIGISFDTTTVPTTLRAGYSAGVAVSALTVLRLTCVERLAAGAQRVPYILNQGAAAYQVASAVLKIARLSA